MKVILQAFAGKLQSDVLDIEESPDKTFRLHMRLNKTARRYSLVARAEAVPARGGKIAHFEDTGKTLADAKYLIKIYELVDISERIIF